MRRTTHFYLMVATGLLLQKAVLADTPIDSHAGQGSGGQPNTILCGTLPGSCMVDSLRMDGMYVKINEEEIILNTSASIKDVSINTINSFEIDNQIKSSKRVNTADHTNRRVAEDSARVGNIRTTRREGRQRLDERRNSIRYNVQRQRDRVSDGMVVRESVRDIRRLDIGFSRSLEVRRHHQSDRQRMDNSDMARRTERLQAVRRNRQFENSSRDSARKSRDTDRNRRIYAPSAVARQTNTDRRDEFVRKTQGESARDRREISFSRRIELRRQNDLQRLKRSIAYNADVAVLARQSKAEARQSRKDRETQRTRYLDENRVDRTSSSIRSERENIVSNTRNLGYADLSRSSELKTTESNKLRRINPHRTSNGYSHYQDRQAERRFSTFYLVGNKVTRILDEHRTCNIREIRQRDANFKYNTDTRFERMHRTRNTLSIQRDDDSRRMPATRHLRSRVQTERDFNRFDSEEQRFHRQQRRLDVRRFTEDLRETRGLVDKQELRQHDYAITRSVSELNTLSEWLTT